LSNLRQCVILVGGLGTRLGQLTAKRPKPLLPIGDRPFLGYLIWHARRFGFERILLLAGYKADVLREELDALQMDGLSIEVIAEPQPLGTGGAICAARHALDEQFLLMNGDSLFDFNWLSLTDALREDPECAVAMSLRAAPDASRFGVVELADGRVNAFHERGGPEGGLINAGVYLMRRRALDGFPDTGSFEREILPALAARGRVRGQVRDGFFLDIGVPDSYEAAQTAVPASLTRGALFLDRDGVVNEDDGYVHRIDQVRWVPGAIETVRRANDQGLFVFIVTNQAGVARGYYDEADVKALHAAMQQVLRQAGAHVDDFRYCPHHLEGVRSGYAVACDWRKPEPGMIRDLAAKWPVDLGASLLIGDNETDVQAAVAAGVPGVLYQGGRLDETLASAEADGAARRARLPVSERGGSS
jgi:D-glycero-D-manno-heptose 1,7-bisphosphate phosphatase